MKRTSGFYAVVKSMDELCRWMQKNDIEIVEMRPGKVEDCVIIDYVYKQQEES